MTKYLVSPSILSGDFADMGSSVKAIERWGGDLVHCDVMDGVYVKNLTFGMPMIAALRKVTTLPLDVHLMITEPERYVEEFVRAGADIVTFHVEASKDPLKTLRKIRSLGCKGGIVFNPDIPFEGYEYLADESDMILVMSVYAGKGGQSFIPETLDKVRAIRNYLNQKRLNVPIEIDGGVNEQNAAACREAGVTVLVAGSSVYKSDDPARTIRILQGLNGSSGQES